VNSVRALLVASGMALRRAPYLRRTGWGSMKLIR
jgi:hypothetical protein